MRGRARISLISPTCHTGPDYDANWLLAQGAVLYGHARLTGRTLKPWKAKSDDLAFKTATDAKKIDPKELVANTSQGGTKHET